MPDVQHTQEYRFGIVMYGGVSLAIYMNGIAQELLRMVRATAPQADNPDALLIPERDLSGSEAVYRQVGRMLSFSEPVRTDVTVGDPVRTRFVVDVISGTSAGGINGVFLAKALVNNQSIEELKQLWVDEGDLGKLLNDAQSVKDIRPLPPSDPPESLLNSRRMYKKLLDAFRGMGPDRPLPSPLVDELDLSVTTTDVHGAPVKLRLLDGTVYERRHRNVFHFGYRRDNGFDGDWENNPFSSRFSQLHAFAARCTSAFPFAFEPMTLAQAAEVTGYFPEANEVPLSPQLLALALGEADYDVEQTADHALDPAGTDDVATRAFTDGGYLDNKPFSYAIDALANRRSRLPVTRKLLYVEPSPELISPIMDAAKRRVPPNALENVKAALLGVPRYETIREDLQRVLQRNRTADRIGRILDQLDNDFTVQRESREPPKQDYGTKYLDDLMSVYGLAYAGYHRLKISVLTDRLADEVGRAARVDPASDRMLAVQLLVKAWREARYSDYRSDDEKTSSAMFLLAFDVGYRLRRLDFLLHRVERFARRDPQALASLASASKQPVARFTASPDELRRVCAALRDRLEVIRRDLAKGERRVLCLTEQDAQILGRAVSNADLDAILEGFTESERLARADAVLRRNGDHALKLLDELAVTGANGSKSLATRVRDLTDPAATALKNLVNDADATSDIDKAVRNALERDYLRFEDYDQVTYTALFETTLGEERHAVDVLRVSPTDATALSNDANRLAGFSLGHFGAFLDADWRRHDITWGRLDGAERIITALLPDPRLKPKRDELIRRAHIAIIREQLKGPDHDAMIRLLQRLSSEEAQSFAKRVVAAPVKSATDEEIRTVVAAAWSDDALYSYFKHGSYTINKLERPAMARIASRSSIVMGRVLEGIGGRWGAGGSLAWLTRIARMFWGVVEVAIPGSVVRAVFVHLTRLFLLFSVLITVVGLIMGSREILMQGATWVVVGGGFVFLQMLLENALKGGTGWKALVLLIATAAMVVLVWSVQAGLPIVLKSVGITWTIPNLRTAVVIAGVVVLISALFRYVGEIWSWLRRQGTHARQAGTRFVTSRAAATPAEKQSQPATEI